jgi:hypothetical protein
MKSQEYSWNNMEEIRNKHGANDFTATYGGRELSL